MTAPENDVTTRRAALERLLDDQHASATSVSPEQRRLLMLMRLEPDMPAVRVHGYRLRGEVDVASLQLGLAELCGAHDILRSTFGEVAGQPVRVVAPVAHVTVTELTVGAGRPRTSCAGTPNGSRTSTSTCRPLPWSARPCCTSIRKPMSCC